jgi:hypothetical protein
VEEFIDVSSCNEGSKEVTLPSDDCRGVGYCVGMLLHE